MARKLLLADDSITIQKVVELVLAEEGFEIKAVNNGEEALAALAGFNPDIILADVEMPKMNGYQLCEKVKTNSATKGVPVILLSGAFEPLDEELAKQVGADSFVVKPFESQELISKINASLLGPAIEEEPVLAAEPVLEAEEEVVVAEAVGEEEDLWAMEATEESPSEEVGIEIPMEEVPAEIMPEAGVVEVAEAEEVDIAEAFEAVEEAAPTAEIFGGEEIPPPVFGMERAAESAPSHFAPERPLRMPEVSLPSKEEFALIFKKAVDEKISSFISTVDMKDAVLSAIGPSLKDSVEKILWEVAPELTEKVLRDMIQSSLSSLSKEVEKIIWETVPEVAERIIAKEIEKIRSEI